MLGWAVRQESALLLRHWWPLATLGATRWSNVRRALATALVVDTAVLVAERRGATDRLAPSPPRPADVSTTRRTEAACGGAAIPGPLPPGAPAAPAGPPLTSVQRRAASSRNRSMDLRPLATSSFRRRRSARACSAPTAT